MNTEKQILTKNVEDISKIIFGESELKTSVFSKGEKIEHLNIITDYDFICEIELRKNKIDQEQIDRLSKFINKEVKHSGKNLKKVFWLVGTNGTQRKIVNKLQSEITLPSFLDTYIFDKLSASFSPDYTKFNRNLNHKEEDVLIYLGTYFPRSFAETYLIFKNILQNENVKKSINKKEEINILDVGSGTGGDLSGLLLNLIEKAPHKVNFNIVAIDGNNEALKLLEKIILQFRVKFNLNISLNCHYVTFETVTDLYIKSKRYFESNFDFIISSKLINEIITKDSKSYFNFYIHFANCLNDEGLLLLLDVTTKVNNEYMPILLNKQTNEFIQKEKTYKTLIPTSCGEYDEICSHDCFTNNYFYINHKMKKNDKSKITYRVIGKKNFIQSILNSLSEKGSVVGWDDLGNKKYCKFMFSANNKSGYEI